MIYYNPSAVIDIFGYSVKIESIAMIYSIFVLGVLTYLSVKNNKMLKYNSDKSLNFILFVFGFSALMMYLLNIIFSFSGATMLILIGLVFVSVLLYSVVKNKNNFIVKTALLADELALNAGVAIFSYRLLGCNFRGDKVGTPTDLWFGYMWPDGIIRHPEAMYYAISGIVIFLVLYLVFRRGKSYKVE